MLAKQLLADLLENFGKTAGKMTVLASVRKKSRAISALLSTRSTSISPLFAEKIDTISDFS